jgi:hypothetical protein
MTVNDFITQNVGKRPVQSRKRELAYNPSLWDDIAAFPRCPKCNEQYAPLKPLVSNRGVLVPRIRCRHCKARLNPIRMEHFEQATTNARLIRAAIRLHRKDLYAEWNQSQSFRDELMEWVVFPLAVVASKHNPDRTKFSTYAVAALRNWLNREYPIMLPRGRGGDYEPYDGIAAEAADEPDEEV